jgi:hypothetical protein
MNFAFYMATLKVVFWIICVDEASFKLLRSYEFWRDWKGKFLYFIGENELDA